VGKRLSIAVYAGTFDPFTDGHKHILTTAADLVDEVILAIGENPEKKTMFRLSDRLEMLADVAVAYPNVKVQHFVNEYLVSYAQKIGAKYIIRGLRNPTDFTYEQTMYQINRSINPGIQTVFVMADAAYANISSSMVKGMIGPEGWRDVVVDYIPHEIRDRFFALLDMR
jgi:pantetheine-phosphate adenylyltransferase